MKAVCEVHWLGEVPYEQARRLQEHLAGEIAAGVRPPTLLLLEHPHTFTFGRSGKPENLVWDQAECARLGIEVHWIDRGGDVTYHGPGQLVGYPLLPLGAARPLPEDAQGQSRMPQADYVGYIRNLETALIAALAGIGTTGFQIPGLTGVWVSSSQAGLNQRPGKIAAIGVKVDARGISRHGFALNINPDMDYWQGIIGCGLKDHPVAALADLLDPLPDMQAIRIAVVESFGRVFGLEMLDGVPLHEPIVRVDRR